MLNDLLMNTSLQREVTRQLVSPNVGVLTSSYEKKQTNAVVYFPVRTQKDEDREVTLALFEEHLNLTGKCSVMYFKLRYK